MVNTVEQARRDDTAPNKTFGDLHAELHGRDLSRHIALFYRSKAMQLDGVAAFLTEGLQSGNRCLYLTDVNSATEIKTSLRDFDIDVEQRISDGDLEFREATDVYLDSEFDPSRMITALENQAYASVDRGYTGLWVAGENSWCFHTDQSFDHILDFEVEFDATCPDLPVTALCQYDLTRFNERSAAKALWTHEQVIYRNLVCDNPFYVSPDDFQSAGSPHLNAQLMLEQAYALTNAKQEILRHEQRLEVVNRVLRHNIRNDLNVVQGILELLADTEGLAPETQDRISLARKHTNSVVEIAEKARYVQQTMGTASVEPQSLNEIIEAAVDEVITEYPDADVQISGPREMKVLADDNLDVAIQEALENGIIHQEAPSPTVFMEVSRLSSETARIEIQNKGSIPHQDRYTLTEEEETKLEHASGLGLWLIKWIVENAHGTVEFPESKSGQAQLRIDLYRIPA